jgi:hypothetical protein
MSAIEYGALTVSITLAVALAGLIRWFGAETQETQKKLRYYQKEVLTLNKNIRDINEEFSQEKTKWQRKLLAAEQEYIDFKQSIEERDAKRAVRNLLKK